MRGNAHLSVKPEQVSYLSVYARRIKGRGEEIGKLEGQISSERHGYGDPTDRYRRSGIKFKWQYYLSCLSHVQKQRTHILGGAFSFY